VPEIGPDGRSASETMSARTSSTSGPERPGRKADGVRETLESIVVAFILAFVFRAFIVEAFVIPTGSMATTLYGEHATHVCTNCGWQFAYGITRSEAGEITPRPTRAECPNCGFIDSASPGEFLPPDAGDRIVVLKWPLEVGAEFLKPRRWEVTVFKNPADGTMNYIKRLVGCPNEVLELIDGDVYTVPTSKLDAETFRRLDRIRALNYERIRLQQEEQRAGYETPEIAAARVEINRELAALQPAVLRVLDGCLRIQRKTPDVTRAQTSLWSIVFDQDHLPQQQPDIAGWRPTAPGTAWDTSQRVIRFSGLDRSGESIRLFKRADDFSAYNQPNLRDRAGPTVSDRRVTCLFTPLRGDGKLRLLMTKYYDEFVAELDVAAGTASLRMTSRPPQGKPRSVTIGTKPVVLEPGRPVPIELANFDYRASLALNGEEILATDDHTYAPDVAWLRRVTPAQLPEPVLEISAERLDLELRHLRVERDVYYTNESLCRAGDDREGRGQRNPFCAPGNGRGRGSEVPGWGTQNNPILLRDKEYFMLGDNSPASQDSRLWWQIGPHLAKRKDQYQVGTVPEDQLLGRAFFVYWPSGFRREWGLRIGLIPNAGEMRWIR